MNSKSIINMHDIIKKYSLPISRKDESIKDCLGKSFKSFYLDLKEIVSNDFPGDFPPKFYNNLLSENMPIISKECAMILDILKLGGQDNQATRSEKFDNLMRFLVNQDAFRVDTFYKGSLMARIRPKIESYERKNMFHIPFTLREYASSGRFSIPNSPCLYLSFYQDLKPHNYEMVKAAWIECGMPSKFTYCIYELQKELNVLHLGNSGSYYLSSYDYEKNINEKEKRLKAITQYLLSFPLRAACHISVEDKSTETEVSFHEEYIFPQLLMQWLQKNSEFDGVSYQGASSNPAQRDLYIGNLALPARNISAENEYDPYLKECFKLSDPKEKDLSKDFNSDEMIQKIEAFESYSEKLKQILNTQNVPSNHPYTDLFYYCSHLRQIYSKMVATWDIYAFYEKFVSIYGIVQTIDSNIMNCKTAEEWIGQYDSSKLLTEADFENVLSPFHNTVIPVCQKINSIFYLQDCGSFLKEMNFQYI
ncbi:MAG: hypothetical protein NC485_11195 [Ruminococcus flavefaciens]|nr:hypothetical protein [Ruminococcus flavefaciens]MCM1062221.1 hypothetical protein [Eubacterium sp.]